VVPARFRSKHMSNAIVVRTSALPSVEKARALLAETCSVEEIQKIKVIAQAVATLERGKEIACDAGEIIVLADTRRAELEAEERAGRKKRFTSENQPRGNIDVTPLQKRELMAESRRAPLLHLPNADRDKYFAQCRKALVPATTMSVAALAKLDEPKRKKVLSNLTGAKDIKKAIGEVRLEAKRELAERIRKSPIVTPDGRYQVIVADPPWKYDNRAEDTTHRGANPYPDMSINEICDLPVEDLAQDNCILWLWTTNAFMREAYQCLDAWGFTSKTILTWDKEIMGVGDWLRGQTEHCLVAVKGRPIISLTNQTTILREKRREHSRKPDGFYSLVENLCPGSKLEMFSRAARPGWVAWGAESGKFSAA
jgi:N6-adenosine-specific RNA methylase IME4